ncbi:hypothetical protein Poli38472_009028 [Pythium oligandrum]|uniref:Ubiquitinyl hydrolase 1 n=1 Tax=Pythium oligandrum TaxID=41045 RepID=A0A8K1FJF4_PYTOL|nr:hypothetical protein Poli38472_009028 [Pythium oligandrum]|eukprot:TMW64861.1 hypothetical protein Poli38472_009028 [Pythium oligandrum]
MEPPGGHTATNEALQTRLQALLRTVVAAARDGATDAAAIAAEFSPEDQAFWEELSNEVLADIGVLVATLAVSTEQLVSMMQSMLVHDAFKTAGVQRVVIAMFEGLKVAKRWDALRVVSLALTESLYARILAHMDDPADARFLRGWLRFYLEIVLGYQHSGELFVREVPKLIELATSIAAKVQDSALRVDVVAVSAALVHLHCGYEREGQELRNAIKATFSVPWPAVADCEAALRDAAWVLPAHKLSRYLTTIEGKWVLDENSSDQHASTPNTPQNAGSIDFKKIANCLAYEFSATIENKHPKSQLQLDGALCCILSDDGSETSTALQLEGHWSQILESKTGLPLAGPVVAPSEQREPWACPACTMNNEASATKCSTCGTEAAKPSTTVQATNQGGARGNNPAPFQAVLNAERSFMRVRWSRGEQHGVWLAKRESVAAGFDLNQSLSKSTAHAMMDSNAIPVYAYSPRGDPTRVVLLEKPYPLSTYGELSVQIWIEPEASTEPQVVLATGDFTLTLEADGHLSWIIANGSANAVSIRASEPLVMGRFHHVTLSCQQQVFQLILDNAVLGSSSRSSEATTSRSSSSWFTIGGQLKPDGSEMQQCFSGIIVDLRIWSEVGDAIVAHSANARLHGSEKNLLGYFPLVGDAQRLLMDVSKHENHATVYAAVLASSSSVFSAVAIDRVFCPATAVQVVPVANSFTSSMDAFEISGRAAYADQTSEGDIALGLEGAASIWYRDSVSIEHGFESTYLVGSATPHSPVVFAISEVSYWNASPLLYETQLLNAKQIDKSTFDGTALMIALEPVAQDASSRCNLAVYVWKNHQALSLCRACNIQLSGDQGYGLKIVYSPYQHALRLEVIGSGLVLETAIDLTAALNLQSNSVRTGLVVSASGHEALALSLKSWSLATFGAPVDDDSLVGTSNLHSVYAPLRSSSSQGSGDPSSSEPSASETVACSRTTSDGSAFEQVTYGCQTCNIIHGAGLCRVCATVCHEGHELVYMGNVSTACACSMRGAGVCKTSAPVPLSENPAAANPPRVHLWCCSRCTVVNGQHQRECSVCGNSAPDASAMGATAEAAGTATSTSRALVPVESPPAVVPVAAQWSCPACTYLNAGDVAKCIICDTAKPAPIEAPAQETAKKADGDGLMTLYYAAETQASKPAVPVAAAPTQVWACGACTMENAPTDTVCFMCSTARPIPVAEPVPAAVPAHPTDALSVVPMTMDTTSTAVTAAAALQPLPTTPPSGGISGGIAPASEWSIDGARRLNEYRREQAQARLGGVVRPSSFHGSTWDTTAGLLTMSLGESFVGQFVEGEYAEKDGYVRGIAGLTPDGAWKLVGRFKKLTQTQENAVQLLWDRGASRFNGKWYRGDGSGDWKCLASPYDADFRGLATLVTTDKSLFPKQQPFYSGLINMKQNLTNVCYQNSFIQTLFLTQEFRRLILSANLEDYVHIPAEDGSHQGDMLQCIRDLFARLLVSQRPHLDTHALQRCLPPTFQAGRQQDTSDFAHFLIDSLSQQLNQHECTRDGIDQVFGGTQATVLACKTCGKTSIIREYFWEMLLNMIDLRYTPITGITAVTGSTNDIAVPAGYERLNCDVNKDRNGAPYVYLCVKRSPETTSPGSTGELALAPITDIVVKIAAMSDARPVMEGYERVPLDLNIGGNAAVLGGKKQVYLFFKREPNGSPITDLQVIYNNEPVPDGFKQIRTDLNQGDGTKVFLCYRCDIPITDLKIVNSGIPGYRMIDYVLNRSNEDAVKQYLAYKVGGNEPCLTDLQLVAADAVDEHIEKGWESIGSASSSVVAADGSSVAPDQLMIRRGHGNPIFAIDVFRAPRLVPRYKDYEVIDLYSSETAELTSLDSAAEALKGDWLAGEDVDRSRKAVRIHSISEPVTDAAVVSGNFDDKGEITAVATPVQSWSQSFGSDGAVGITNKVLRVTGHWKSSKTKQHQLFDVELRPTLNDTANNKLYTLTGTVGDGKGRSIAVTGSQVSRNVRVKWPISQVLVLRGDERVPEGVEVVKETCSGKNGNLLAQTQSPHTLYLAVKREEKDPGVFEGEGSGYVSDVCVIYGDIDAVPEDYTCIDTTPAGHSANLNDGTTGVPIFLCYRRTKNPTEKCLMDLALMWTSGAQTDTLPAGFTKIQHTPLGMEANLNQGTNGVAIHLCFAKCDPNEVAKPIDDPLNGEYEISVPAVAATTSLFGKFIRLSAVERIAKARTVEGKFGTVFLGYLPGMIRGTLYSSTRQKQHILSGVWMSDEQNASSMIDIVPPSYPCELTLNESGMELSGWWSGADEATATTSTASTTTTTSTAPAAKPTSVWKLMKDSYVRVAFKKDYGTEWKEGQLISSERVWRHDIASMLSRFVALRTMGGDNQSSCSDCNRKTESRTHTVIVSPPAHLILTLKRMSYDWEHQKTVKSLHDVTFPALMTLPALTEEDEATLYTENDDQALKISRRQRQYGLYGVLVHSGLTANSGHYYSFCRESDDSTQQLHLEDAPLAPWIKFNDIKVECSSWTEINRTLSHSVSDTVYLLLYKRLSYVPSEATIDESAPMVLDSPGSDDEDEAMLLAKAMALSMAAASQGQAAQEESKQEDDEATATKVHVESKKSRVIISSVLREVSEHLIMLFTIRQRSDDLCAAFNKVEQANWQFMDNTMTTAVSRRHCEDLNTIVALRHGLSPEGLAPSLS